MSENTSRIYVIAAPIIKTGWPWEQRIKRIRKLLPDVTLTGWEHLPEAFKAIPRAEQPARLARALAGAVVVAGCLHDRWWIGPRALEEIRAFLDQRKNVYIYAAGQLTPWEQCSIARPDDAPRLTPLEILAPASTKETAWA